ncbi:hypothetical protein ABZ235_40105 [Streptomyces canus]|uniref:hypothetical protein n=1 Tax=Streptomyces canus TaxID=58343 RepID=UPI0033A95A72
MLTATEAPEQAPRLLGVDEFTFQKGWRYGTVLVDVEAARAWTSCGPGLGDVRRVAA